MDLALKPFKSVLKNRDHGWGPFVWFVYSGFFFVQPVLAHVSLGVWLLDIAGYLVFCCLYFGLFWLERPNAIVHIGGLILLGLLFLPYNGGAAGFFIFAAAFVPFSTNTKKTAILGIIAISTAALVESSLLHLDWWTKFWSCVFPLTVGGSNVFFAERNRMNCKLRKANEEIEHLAKVAERERIARDLHDVLGHTLSVITLKSELAGKLIDRDPERAGKEIREVEKISRQALSDVRDAIRGYRSKGLVAELAQAKSTLETAGLTVQCDAATSMQLPPMQESVLSLAVREGVTNVVRHANARNCRLRIEQQNDMCRLEIADDGQGFVSMEGNGLRGMRERVEMLGGTLDRRNKSGTILTITLPLKEVAIKDVTEIEAIPEQDKAHEFESSR
jgi:two-component system sensor histidine kinase DesK